MCKPKTYGWRSRLFFGLLLSPQGGRSDPRAQASRTVGEASIAFLGNGFAARVAECRRDQRARVRTAPQAESRDGLRRSWPARRSGEPRITPRRSPFARRSGTRLRSGPFHCTNASCRATVSATWAQAGAQRRSSRSSPDLVVSRSADCPSRHCISFIGSIIFPLKVWSSLSSSCGYTDRCRCSGFTIG